MTIKEAKTILQFQAIEKLAWEILPEFYRPYIPDEHTIFFLNKYQTVEVIREQIHNGFEYYILSLAGNNAGFLGIETANDQMNLSKLYILKQYRGKKIGEQAMVFTETRATELNAGKIELIVNRKNSRAIKFYERHGFKVAEELVHNFENGYSIEDYKMIKVLRAS